MTQDATALTYFPQTLAECDELFAGVTGYHSPFALYRCQEASGDLADSIGSFTLTHAGAGIGYQTSVAGYTFKGVLTHDGVSEKFTSVDSGLPDVDTQSFSALAWMLWPATNPGGGSARSLLTIGPNFGAQTYVDATSAAGALLVGGSGTQGGGFSGHRGDKVGASNPYNAVHPVLLQVERSAGLNTTGTFAITTDQEEITDILTPSGVPTGKKIWIGGDNGNTWLAGGATVMWMALFSGAGAELGATGRGQMITAMGTGPGGGGGGGGAMSRGRAVNGGGFGGTRGNLVNARSAMDRFRARDQGALCAI